LKKKPKHITIYEHQSLKVGHTYNGIEFTEGHRLQLETFYGEKGVPFYKLIHKGVQFNEYAGALHLGKLLIEVLPKADKYEQTEVWRDILINMLRAVGAFNIHAPSSSSLNIKTNFILDLYFELFIKEVEYLLNKGLIKKYRKKEGNSLSLKGSIVFDKQIQKNLVHQERFYVKHSTYDKQHLLHKIFYKTILLLQQINTNTILSSRIGRLLLNFPECKDIKVTEGTFDKIILNRKTEEYINALEISRLLLLNYHPDLSNGRNNVLALMFDMNLLWEQFIYKSLRRNLKENMSITAQTSMNFWKSHHGNNSTIRPDIKLMVGSNAYILDTKWKNIGDKNPSPEDLRQLFVYHEYYDAQKVALVYPGKEMISTGTYSKTIRETKEKPERNKECSIIRIQTDKTIPKWQDAICNKIYSNWLGIDSTSKYE